MDRTPTISPGCTQDPRNCYESDNATRCGRCTVRICAHPNILINVNTEDYCCEVMYLFCPDCRQQFDLRTGHPIEI